MPSVYTMGPMYRVSVCPVCHLYPVYTVSVRPVYTSYTELGSGKTTITNSDLNRPCFAWHPYGKSGLFKTELVIKFYIIITLLTLITITRCLSNNACLIYFSSICSKECADTVETLQNAVCTVHTLCWLCHLLVVTLASSVYTAASAGYFRPLLHNKPAFHNLSIIYRIKPLPYNL